MVDPGGNWLRFYQQGATEEEPEVREPAAPAVERGPLILYRAELLARLGRAAEAAEAVAKATDGLTADEAAALGHDVEHAREVVESA